MSCIKCNSDRVIGILGKSGDRYNHIYKGKQYDGYAPFDIGIGGGDYIQFNYCLECGQIQDKFPKGDPVVEEYDDVEEVDYEGNYC